MSHEHKSIGREESAAEKTEREAIDDVALRASEDPLFIELVGEASSKMEALQKVREHMESRYPEVKDIELAEPGVIQAVPEFRVSKAVVDLLWERT